MWWQKCFKAFNNNFIASQFTNKYARNYQLRTQILIYQYAHGQSEASYFHSYITIMLMITIL